MKSFSQAFLVDRIWSVLAVFTGQELQDDDGAEGNTFDPEFSERIFGEDGKIYGYTGLKVSLKDGGRSPLSGLTLYSEIDGAPILVMKN